MPENLKSPPPGPKTCPGCAGIDPLRLRFEKKDRRYYRCTSCSLEFQFPLPSPEELSRYYDESYSSGMYQAFASAALMKHLTAAERLREIRRFQPAGPLLDIGCGNGVFVAEARADGLDASGIELSAIAVSQAQSRGLPVFHSTIEAFKPEQRYAALTGFDVIEHVLDPYSFLTSARELLADRGRLILTTPNTDSIVCKLMGPRWYFYIPDEHLHLFNRRSIDALLERSGFRLLHSGWTYKPLTFDYSLIQFQEYNPLIYGLLRPFQRVLPSRLRSTPVPLYIGEMLVVAERK